MKNLKVSVKLFVGFGMVLVLVIALGIVSLLEVGNLGKVLTQYSEKTVPNTQYIWQIRRDMVSIQRYVSEAIASANYEIRQELVADAESERVLLNESIEQYKKNMRTDPKLMSDFEAKLGPVAEYRAELLQMLSEPRTEENDAKIFKMFQENYVPAFDIATESVDKIAAGVDDLAIRQENIGKTAISRARMLVAVILCGAIAITIIMVLAIRKSILVPVKEIEFAAKEMAEGRMSTKIEYQSKDELGSLAEAMRTQMESLNRYIYDIDKAMGQMAQGDFRIQPSQPFAGDFKSIETSITDFVSKMTETLTQINIASDEVSSGSEQVSSGAQALSQGATEQASSIEELSAALSEISEQIRKSAQNAESAKAQSEKAGEEVSNSNNEMQQMITAMNNISDKSTEISKIIKTIEDIAFQTNILALNAAVEAARAGAAGKGFAVVADEVRNLAGKSAEAAKNTTTLIGETVQAVEEGTKIVDNTAKSMLNVVDASQSATDLILEIATASKEQASSIEQITMGVDQISSVVQTNSATAEESAAASEELSGQSQMLKSLVSQFQMRKN